MEIPHSLRLGKPGKKLSKISRRTGLSCPDVTKLALEQLFAAYPKDNDLKLAVFAYRANERARAAK